jgi:adenylate cyclase
MRHMAMGGGKFNQLDDLRTPMAVVLDNLADQLAELERYKAKFGPLDDDTDEDSDAY